MCGICGFVYEPGQELVLRGVLGSMLTSLTHRGPDAGAEYLVENESSSSVALGHRRLSIIDLEQGAQPMERRGRVVTFNGEIYNYRELKSQLVAAGFSFTSNSDTEVLLAAYERWGARCVEYFVGMFAFVLYDPERNILFMARDRLGKKPFFYYHGEKKFIFGSEIKSILAHPHVCKTVELDLESLSDYLSLGYILHPKTIYKQIRKLPGGYSGEYCLRTHGLKLYEYWGLAKFYLAEKKESGRLLDQEFSDLLEDSVALRMRSDVPLGAFLSGGVDSSAIVATMKDASHSDVRSYSVRFKHDSYDETEYAELVARHLGVQNEVIDQGVPGENEVSRLVWFLDEPFCDTSLVPTYLVSESTRKRAKVALSGDGADELFAGYVTYLANDYFKLYSIVPVRIQKYILQSAKKLLKPTYKKLSFDYKVLQFLKSYGLSRERAHYLWRNIFDDDEKKKVLTKDFICELNGYDPYLTFDKYFQDVGASGFLDRTLYVDIKTWLQDGILVKVDKMSMATSLEVRCPFLDHRLVELAARLPENEKKRFMGQKRILKKVMKNKLPKKILSRSKKGFLFPAHLISAGTVKFNGPEGIFDKSYFLEANCEDVTFKSFNMYVFNIWFDMFERYKKLGVWEPIEYGE
jgi:asparagine synthase (glutamine-hydrolysing)